MVIKSSRQFASLACPNNSPLISPNCQNEKQLSAVLDMILSANDPASLRRHTMLYAI